ncbi:MAG: hypothetical protein KF878_27065 [Planctomycetes bacterium]|nr:hypothetical protein [Planctomycetota bacterium]MCW8140451.1 hypothetical protein [Planctomycetota bacterium]
MSMRPWRLVIALVAAGIPALPALRAQEGARDELGPPPFTAAQIQEATRAGRRYLFKIEAPGEPVQFQLMEFTAVSAAGATLRQSTLDAERKPEGAPAEAEVTWSDLEAQGRFPRARTRVTEEELSLPAGKFACKVYRVDEPDVVVTHWFATSLPGAPVKVEAKEGGHRLVFTMTLVEHVNPSKSE